MMELEITGDFYDEKEMREDLKLSECLDSHLSMYLNGTLKAYFPIFCIQLRERIKEIKDHAEVNPACKRVP